MWLVLSARERGLGHPEIPGTVVDRPLRRRIDERVGLVIRRAVAVGELVGVPGLAMKRPICGRSGLPWPRARGSACSSRRRGLAPLAIALPATETVGEHPRPAVLPSSPLRQSPQESCRGSRRSLLPEAGATVLRPLMPTTIDVMPNAIRIAAAAIPPISKNFLMVLLPSRPGLLVFSTCAPNLGGVGPVAIGAHWRVLRHLHRHCGFPVSAAGSLGAGYRPVVARSSCQSALASATGTSRLAGPHRQIQPLHLSLGSRG